jgi:2'-5' RNA ligase
MDLLPRLNSLFAAASMRLFTALDIDGAIRERIMRFIEGVRNFAPDARWVKPEGLHITLKFIGEQPEDVVDPIKRALTTINSGADEIQFQGYGFFPTAKSARVFWIGLESGPQLSGLASMIDEKMSSLGIERKRRVFSPHITLARGPGASAAPDRHQGKVPNATFQRLQEKLSGLSTPDFGTMTPREFFLYQSHLSPKGSTYTKLATFGLQ